MSRTIRHAHTRRASSDRRNAFRAATRRERRNMRQTMTGGGDNMEMLATYARKSPVMGEVPTSHCPFCGTPGWFCPC